MSSRLNHVNISIDSCHKLIIHNTALSNIFEANTCYIFLGECYQQVKTYINTKIYIFNAYISTQIQLVEIMFYGKILQ